MNETLKGVAHIGAELAAAKADLQREMERHRKTWRQLEQVTGLLKRVVDELDDLNSAWLEQADDCAEPDDERDHCDATQELIDEVRDLLSQQTEQQPVTVPEGWKLVPSEPTRAMCLAAQRERREYPVISDRDSPVVLWRAMLSAAPIAQTAPQPEQSGLVEAVKEAVKYLDENYLNQISSRSRLHLTLRAALSAQRESHE